MCNARSVKGSARSCNFLFFSGSNPTGSIWMPFQCCAPVHSTQFRGGNDDFQSVGLVGQAEDLGSVESIPGSIHLIQSIYCSSIGRNYSRRRRLREHVFEGLLLCTWLLHPFGFGLGRSRRLLRSFSLLLGRGRSRRLLRSFSLLLGRLSLLWRRLRRHIPARHPRRCCTVGRWPWRSPRVASARLPRRRLSNAR